MADLGLGAAATGCTIRQGPGEAEDRESDPIRIPGGQYVFGYGSLIQKESREDMFRSISLPGAGT
ncbi:hypothetical protein ACFC18_45595 [Streptomyces sp. NPDC056121]|uniref:hypothetical protein n=1 Tax=unclassified Streptomyces TaxID=2593676 RepID=UPI0035DF9788